MKKFIFFLLVCFIILSNFSIAKANSTYNWNNIEIEIYYPDKVTYGCKFDIGFYVNSTNLYPDDMMAFIPNIWVSNTVNISDVFWSEVYVSPLDPGFHGDFAGSLGIPYAPYTQDINGFNIELYDPYYSSLGSNYTWLTRSFQDQVTWTLHDFIIQGDTNFYIKLDTDIYDTNSPELIFTVIDPPAAFIASTVVPEPASITFLLSGIFCLGLIKRKRI